jgi:hypothetical protein
VIDFAKLYCYPFSTLHLNEKNNEIHFTNRENIQNTIEKYYKDKKGLEKQFNVIFNLDRNYSIKNEYTFDFFKPKDNLTELFLEKGRWDIKYCIKQNETNILSLKKELENLKKKEKMDYDLYTNKKIILTNVLKKIYEIAIKDETKLKNKGFEKFSPLTEIYNVSEYRNRIFYNMNANLYLAKQLAPIISSSWFKTKYIKEQDAEILDVINKVSSTAQINMLKNITSIQQMGKFFENNENEFLLPPFDFYYKNPINEYLIFSDGDIQFAIKRKKGQIIFNGILTGKYFKVTAVERFLTGFGFQKDIVVLEEVKI